MCWNRLNKKIEATAFCKEPKGALSIIRKRRSGSWTFSKGVKSEENRLSTAQTPPCASAGNLLIDSQIHTGWLDSQGHQRVWIQIQALWIHAATFCVLDHNTKQQPQNQPSLVFKQNTMVQNKTILSSYNYWKDFEKKSYSRYFFASLMIRIQATLVTCQICSQGVPV